MNKISIVLLASLLAVTSCTSLKRTEARIEVVSSSQVQITNANVHREGEFIHVTAVLRPASSTVKRVGHVDVEFLNAEGEVLKEITAEPNVRNFSGSSSRNPTLSIKFNPGDQPVSTIRLTHHVDTFEECEI
jgi:hypothetical protein